MDKGVQSGGTIVPFCTPSMICAMCHLDVSILDGPEELFHSWQNGCCDKADSFVQEPGK